MTNAVAVLPVSSLARRRIEPDATPPFEDVCAQNRGFLGGAGDNAFRPGTLSARTLRRILAVTLPYWRQGRVRPYKGYLFVRTPQGGRRLTHRDLPAFYGVDADGSDQCCVSGRSIQRVLQVVGAAYHAAQGDLVKAEALILALVDDSGPVTPSGLLDRARKTAPWAACLCTDTSDEARCRRLLIRLRSSFDEKRWSPERFKELMEEVSREADRRERRQSRQADEKWARPLLGAAHTRRRTSGTRSRLPETVTRRWEGSFRSGPTSRTVRRADEMGARRLPEAANTAEADPDELPTSNSSRDENRHAPCVTLPAPKLAPLQDTE